MGAWTATGSPDSSCMRTAAQERGSFDSSLGNDARPARDFNARFAATVLAVVAIVGGIGFASYKGREQHSACFSTPEHYLAQPKEGPDRPLRCPVRPAP
jgi:hypothetical protein